MLRLAGFLVLILSLASLSVDASTSVLGSVPIEQVHERGKVLNDMFGTLANSKSSKQVYRRCMELPNGDPSSCAVAMSAFHEKLKLDCAITEKFRKFGLADDDAANTTRWRNVVDKLERALKLPINALSAGFRSCIGGSKSSTAKPLRIAEKKMMLQKFTSQELPKIMEKALLRTLPNTEANANTIESISLMMSDLLADPEEFARVYSTVKKLQTEANRTSGFTAIDTLRLSKVGLYKRDGLVKRGLGMRGAVRKLLDVLSDVSIVAVNTFTFVMMSVLIISFYMFLDLLILAGWVLLSIIAVPYLLVAMLSCQFSDSVY